MKKEKLLKAGLEQLGLSSSEEHLNAFMAYLGELKKWNRLHNLTSLTTDHDIIVKHFLDSCVYLKALENTFSIADIGSGAGFPGIPIKILRPGMEVFLVEPSQKKAFFLRHVIRTLALNKISVVNKRVEDVSDILVEAAVTRALFKARDFEGRAGHLVREGGLFVLSKGPRAEEELSALDTGYRLMEVPLPFAGTARRLVVITKGPKRQAPTIS